MQGNLTRQDLIPWNWALTPANPRITKCHSPAMTLGTLAIVDVLTTISAFFFGSRPVAEFLTGIVQFGLSHIGLKKLAAKLEPAPYGTESTSYKWSWILTVASQFTSNAVIAKFTVDASGDYPAPPSVRDLMLFLFMRPRVSWIIFCIAVPPSLLFSRSYSERRVYNQRSWLYIWTNAAYSNAIAEVVLQIVGAYYTGRTAHFASSHGYYLAGALNGNPFRSDAKMMYAGALLYLVFLVNLVYIAIGLIDPNAFKLDYQRGSDPLLTNFYLALLGWVGSWLFFAGYVRLARDLYCPADLGKQAATWVMFSIVGFFTGAAPQ